VQPVSAACDVAQKLGQLYFEAEEFYLPDDELGGPARIDKVIRSRNSESWSSHGKNLTGVVEIGWYLLVVAREERKLGQKGGGVAPPSDLQNDLDVGHESRAKISIR